MSSVRDTSQFSYDVCLSFAGEQRAYVREVAKALAERGLRVFYDEYEKVNLWGKDLYAHLDDIYQNMARHCVLFASADYANKVWTNHERRSAQARAIAEHGEYILPARFDDTAIPGIPATIGYVDLSGVAPADLAALIEKKVGLRAKRHFLPPIPDRLFERLHITDDPALRETCYSQAYRFLEVLQRMNDAERVVVTKLFAFGCPAELPKNMHIYVDLLRRVTGFSVPKLKRILGGLSSLGFKCRIREAHGETPGKGKVLGTAPLFELEWSALMAIQNEEEMMVAHEMVRGAMEDYCEEHGLEALQRLDFSQLATVTTSEDRHD